MTACYNISLIHTKIKETVIIFFHRTDHGCVSSTASRCHDQHNRTRHCKPRSFHSESFCSRRIKGKSCRRAVDQMFSRLKLFRKIILSSARQFFCCTKISFFHIFFPQLTLYLYTSVSSCSNFSASSKNLLLISDSGFPSITVFP